MSFESLAAQSLNGFAGMFQDPKNRWFAVYLLTSLGLAYAVYRAQARQDPHLREEGFFGFVFPSEVWNHPSAWVDYKFYLVNKLMFGLVFAGLAVSTTIAFKAVGQVLSLLGGPLLTGYGILGPLVTTAAFVLAFDFGLWFAHYLFHRIPALWEFHKVHHSAEVMTPLTAGRVHPVDDMVGYLFSGIAGGSMAALCHFVFGPEAMMLNILQLNIAVFVFYLFGFHLRHSHVWLPYTGWLGRVFISPAHHQVHHSSAERHWDRNMGFIFAIWDWMFGTLHVPARRREDFAYGIGGEEKEFNSVWRLYSLPFRKVWRRLRGASPPLAGQLGFADVPAPPEAEVAVRPEPASG